MLRAIALAATALSLAALVPPDASACTPFRIRSKDAAIIVDGANTLVEQVRKQLDKVIDVVKVTDISGDATISRELALIKVKTTPGSRSEIMQIVDIFRAKIVDVASDSLTVEVTGDDAKVTSLYNLFKPFGVKEISRTGVVAMTRGAVVSNGEEKDD